MFFGLCFWDLGHGGSGNVSTDGVIEQQQIHKIIQNTAKNLNIENFNAEKYLAAEKNDRKMGDVYFATINDIDSKTTWDLVIKKAPKEAKHREVSLIEASYKNEIHFYTRIYPKFINLIKTHFKASDDFDPDIYFPIPKYLNSESKLGQEMVVLENLETQNYKLKEMYILPEFYVRSVFKAYGCFHALSLCLKDENRIEFDILLRPLTNIWEKNLANEEYVQKYINLIKDAIDEVLSDPLLRHLRTRLESYLASFPHNLLQILRHQDGNVCLLHGDCSPNNILLNYYDVQNKKMTYSVKFLDFQAIRYGSPVQDLSLFLYLEAADSKSTLDSVEEWLDVYYTSFTDVATKFNKDPEKLLPRDALREEWNMYSQSSLLLAIQLLKEKHLNDLEARERNRHRQISNFRDLDDYYVETSFQRKLLNILLHMYERGAL